MQKLVVGLNSMTKSHDKLQQGMKQLQFEKKELREFEGLI